MQKNINKNKNLFQKVNQSNKLAKNDSTNIEDKSKDKDDKIKGDPNASDDLDSKDTLRANDLNIIEEDTKIRAINKGSERKNNPSKNEKTKADDNGNKNGIDNISGSNKDIERKDISDIISVKKEIQNMEQKMKIDENYSKLMQTSMVAEVALVSTISDYQSECEPVLWWEPKRESDKILSSFRRMIIVDAPIRIFTLKKLSCQLYKQMSLHENKTYDGIAPFIDTRDLFSNDTAFMWEELSDEFFTNSIAISKTETLTDNYTANARIKRPGSYSYLCLLAMNSMIQYYYKNKYCVVSKPQMCPRDIDSTYLYNNWPELPVSLHGINLFCMLPYGNHILRNMITQDLKLDDHVVKFQELKGFEIRDTYNSKIGILYHTFNHFIPTTFYNIRYTHLFDNCMRIVDFENIVNNVSYGRASIDYSKFDSQLVIESRLNMLRPEKHLRSSFLCYYAVSPTLKNKVLSAFQELLITSCFDFKPRTPADIKSTLLLQLKSDTSSIMIAELSRFLDIRPTGTSNDYSPLLTLMAHEHAANAIRIIPRFSRTEDSFLSSSSLTCVVFTSMAIISFCYIAPATFFQPDICTRLIAGLLKEFQCFDHVRNYINAGWHPDCESLIVPPNDKIFSQLPFMFTSSGLLPSPLKEFKAVILKIIEGMKKRVATPPSQSKEFYLCPDFSEPRYYPLLFCESNKDTYRNSIYEPFETCFRSFFRALESCAKIKGNFRLKLSDLQTAKQQSLLNVLHELEKMYLSSFKGISTHLYFSVAMCMRHPLRIGHVWNFDHTVPNNSRIGISLTPTDTKRFNTINMADHQIRHLDVFELAREVLNHPGDFDDSTSGIRSLGDYIPQNPESIFPIKTILSQTFEIFNDDSAYNRVFGAILISSRILNPNADGQFNDDDLKIKLIRDFFQCALSNHVSTSTSAHVAMIKAMSGDYDDSVVNSVLEAIRFGRVHFPMKVTEIKPVMLYINNEEICNIKCPYDSPIMYDAKMLDFVATTITYCFPKFPIGQLASLNIVSGCKLNLVKSFYVLDRATPPTLPSQRTQFIIDEQNFFREIVIASYVLLGVRYQNRDYTLLELQRMIKDGHYIEFLFPKRFKIDDKYILNLLLPLLKSPQFRITLPHVRVRVNRKIIETKMDLNPASFNSDELTLVKDILSSEGEEIIDIDYYYDYTKMSDKNLKIVEYEMEWMVWLNNDDFEKNLICKHLSSYDSATFIPEADRDNWTCTKIEKLEDLVDYNLPKWDGSGNKFLDGKPNYNNILCTLHEKSFANIETLPLNIRKDYIDWYGELKLT